MPLAELDRIPFTLNLLAYTCDEVTPKQADNGWESIPE